MVRKSCPRCGSHSYEILKSHAHCPGCLYSPDLDERYEPDLPGWAHKYLPKESEVSLEAFLQEREPHVSLGLPPGGPAESVVSDETGLEPGGDPGVMESRSGQ